MGRARCKGDWIAAGLAFSVFAGCHSLPGALWPAARLGALVVDLAPAQSRATGSVLYLERPSDSPSRAGSPKQVDVVSEGAAFDPPLHVLRFGDDVRFVNRGTLVHRLFTADEEGRRERVVEPRGSSEPLRITRAGEHRFYCSLHPDESFAVFAAPSDHFIVPDGRPSHRIDGLPAGHYRLRWWSDAGVRSVGVAEIRPGEIATREISLGAASR